MTSSQNKRPPGTAIYVGLQQGVNLLAHVLQILVLSRLLDAKDYGLSTMAGTVFTLANVFKDFGFSVSAIQSEEISKQDSDNLFWVGTGIAGCTALVIAVASPLVGLFYSQEIVTWLVLLMGVTYLIASLGNQPTALAQRAFRFRALALWSIGGKAVGFGTGCCFALAGYGPWSIALMHLVDAAIVSFGGFLVSGYVPGKMNDLAETKSHMKFGAWLTASGILSFISRNIDKILIGRFFGPEALGYYSRAHGLLIFPLTGILSGFHRFNLATLSRLREKSAKTYTEYVELLLQAYILVSASMVVPAVAAANDVIALSMGQKWAPVAPLFVIMAPYAWYQIVSYACNLTIISTGEVAALTRLHIWNCAISTLAIVCAVPFGLSGLAIAFAVSGVVIQQALFLWYAAHNKDLDIRRILRILAINAAFVSLTALSTAWVVHNLMSEWTSLPRTLGAFTFSSVLFGVFLISTNAGRRLLDKLPLRGLLRKRTGSAELS